MVSEGKQSLLSWFQKPQKEKAPIADLKLQRLLAPVALCPFTEPSQETPSPFFLGRAQMVLSTKGQQSTVCTGSTHTLPPSWKAQCYLPGFEEAAATELSLAHHPLSSAAGWPASIHLRYSDAGIPKIWLLHLTPSLAAHASSCQITGPHLSGENCNPST